MVQFSAHVMSRPSGKHGILHNDQRENGCEYFRVVLFHNRARSVAYHVV